MTIANSPLPTAHVADGEQLELPIVGMTCVNCARRVERALGGLPGVQQATINFATSSAWVRFDAATLERAAMVRAVEGAGCRVPGAEAAPKPEL